MSEITVTDVRCQKGDSAFLIDDGKTAILYDTGFGFTGFDIAKKVKKALGNRPLDYIFLTHSHYDHALGSAYVLRYYPDAKVVAGNYCAEIFKRSGAKRVMCELDRKFAETCGISDYEFLGDELRVDIPVDDGDIVKAGDMTFEVITLPGHTKCSIGFYCRDRGLFLSNETLGVYDGDKTIVPAFLIGYDLALKSMDKVLKLDIKQILAPHWGILDEDQTRFFFENMKPATEHYANLIRDKFLKGETAEDILKWFKELFWHGYINEIYPEDAINLNSSIMIELVRKELVCPAE